MSKSLLIPTVNDVLLGRGTLINSHPGNEHFRSLVNSKKSSFVNAPLRKNKREIAQSIIHEIQALNPPGRFLIESDDKFTSNSQSAPPTIHPLVLKKGWVLVDDDKALDKVMHRLRERDKGVPKKRRRDEWNHPQDTSFQQQQLMQPQPPSLPAGGLNNNVMMQQQMLNAMAAHAMHQNNLINTNANGMVGGVPSMSNMQQIPTLPLLQLAGMSATQQNAPVPSVIAAPAVTPSGVFESLDNESLSILILFRREWKRGRKFGGNQIKEECTV